MADSTAEYPPTYSLQAPCSHQDISVAGPLIQAKHPVVIGIYGLSGCGKSTLLAELQIHVDAANYICFDGSQIIRELTQSDISLFKSLPPREQNLVREKAINHIQSTCIQRSASGIVTGHAMIWNEAEAEPEPIITVADMRVYTHVIYLDVSPETVFKRSRSDTKRLRPDIPIPRLQQWRDTEKRELREQCRKHNILFISIAEDDPPLQRIIAMVRDFTQHDESENLHQVQSQLDEIISLSTSRPSTILLFDADRTLGPQDSGDLFWNEVAAQDVKRSPLKQLFSGPLGYKYEAFRQASLLYEEVGNDEAFETYCQSVARRVELYHEMISLLQSAEAAEDVQAIVITCGLKRVWDIVLTRNGLGNVQIIGGGRLSDGYIVSAAVKGAVVTRIRERHKMRVVAFGDSPLDVNMLKKADEAIVVVGEEGHRSKTMDAELRDLVAQGLKARQVLLPGFKKPKPRLDLNCLPLVDITASAFIDTVLSTTKSVPLRVDIASTPAASLLTTRMRDATISGPALQTAHKDAGYYLALQHVPSHIGLGEVSVPHVQGHTTTCHQLLHERKTAIIALMRGGLFTALGVQKAFPNASLHTPKLPTDFKREVLVDLVNVILVDSVINSGKSILEFVQRVHEVHATIRIVVVAGVIQEEAVGGDLAKAHALHPNLSIVGLRVSRNKFKGVGGTDTGNRLSNTTHLA